MWSMIMSLPTGDPNDPGVVARAKGLAVPSPWTIVFTTVSTSCSTLSWHKLSDVSPIKSSVHSQDCKIMQNRHSNKSILYYIILNYIILYYIILNYIILYYIILNYIILYYILFYYIILYHIILYYVNYIILYYIILNYIIFYSILLYYIKLHYIILYYIKLH